MSNTSYNVNNVSQKKITWETIKNKKYTQDSLSQISYLYVIKVYNKKEIHTLINQESLYNIIIKISISTENILMNKLLDIEILEGITFHKFTSKKKDNLLRLQDLSKFFKTSLNIKLPKDIEESFITEYKKATQLLNSSINI
ncbi:hypothetical protein HL033_01990 [Neoehrlichia mikurensis]|uniref:Uncharacterized protein n=1 Tax=Neoehrlichia mikurensis TaxID=89586 RepID=A0A9Q9BTD5_9RICK|nr:hypothetical protein [Neoehrlichia mikurensis]QXK92302.1 hypothetical protein IAH97_01985 [Neoehrlichia mikurensis]QXK92756.1 hypothetical protein HUN61_01980 [Neoehrlichia mikurensis]QXK93997.1 hypothetical protein HL033_01990 [Neoehrlichia mikurensis]UTO55840.1 hypothetical protein LUA82_02125 [Neoehrlichia mikurensis]UTO56755.1 hypothetical protein LUA81_02105 [Neoehrlichia mikurensis]